MIVNNLSVSGFRNLKELAYCPGRNVNIIYGMNAQGKTNILEAIWLFSGSRSFRSAKDSELISIGQSQSKIKLNFEAAGRKQDICIEIKAGRKAELNGIALESPAKLAGNFCAVIFSPEHLGLVKEGPQLRRKFIDAAICQIRPLFTTTILNYRKVLAQRNALLKDIPYHSELLDMLDIWDERLCSIGAELMYIRLRYLKKLEDKAKKIYSGISKNGENLKLEYSSTTNIDSSFYTEQKADAVRIIQKEMLRKLKEQRKTDVESGNTQTGPHRDDLAVFVDSYSAKIYASQGQQRSAVLALKLAEAEVLRENLKEPPILLLDDVMSELDSTRREYLLNNIGDSQVFMTCCDPSGFGSLKNGSVCRMEAGRLFYEKT